MGQDWTIKGDYVEACNCEIACPCVWLDPPDDNACTASLAWYIHDGRYGDIDVSGLGVGMLIASEEGVMFDSETGWDIVLFIDEMASDEQRNALEDIYSGRAGGIFGAISDTHTKNVEVVTAPISFSRDESDFTVEIGDVVLMDVVGKTGFNSELGTITPHPLTKDLTMKTGKSTTATVAYNNTFTWDVAGNNAFFCDFELANV